MKSNFKYILVGLIWPLLLSNQIFSQEEKVGSWIISSDYYPDVQGYANYKINFSENGIMEPTNPQILDSQTSNNLSFAFSMGAYQCEGSLDTYVTDKHYYPNSIQDQWAEDEADSDLGADAQIIHSPLSTSDYMIFYESEYINNGTNHGRGLFCEEIRIENGNVIYTQNPYNFERIGFHLSGSYAISNVVDEERHIYYISIQNFSYYTSDFGLKRFILDDSGFDHNSNQDVLIVDNSSSGLAPHEFIAYNMEMYDKNNVDQPILAWILKPEMHYNGSTYINQTIYIYDENHNQGGNQDYYKIDLSTYNNNQGSGKIAGIEFSPFPDEPDYMYVSCENLGLIKINWRDGTFITQYTSTGIDFSHSFVQTAPDGNVYVVSDDGESLGAISKTPNHGFNNNAFTYPVQGNANRTHINYKDFGNGIKYYTLPENEHPILDVDILATNVLCETNYGRAEIHISGGVPEYTIIVDEIGGGDVTNLFSYDEDCECYVANQLPLGDYEVTVFDNGICGNGMTDTIHIAYGDAYDFEDSLLIINNSTAQNIRGLDDLIWDKDDVDTDKGFLLDNTIMFKHGFQLTDSTVLEIRNLRMEFDEDYLAKVIIEPGSKLILDSCQLSNYHCSDTAKKWAGIQVWGQRDSVQLDVHQGKLIMDETIIEHAHEAVQLYNPNAFNSSGGMIYAGNSTFRNNRRAVSFMSYHNSHPVFGIEYNYYSNFDHCSFINNEYYLNDNAFFSFISMWDVKGVSIKACTFNAGNENGNGINTIDAGFTLSSDCDGPIGPNGCAPEDLERCEFYNFDKAVNARNTSPGTIYPINIMHSYFFNNNYGAYLSGLDNVLKVNTSEFIVGNNGITKEKALCGSFFGRGIHIEESNGFTIENNEFIGNPNAVFADSLIGILANSNPSNHDIIYKNTFTNLKIGNWATHTNRKYQNNDAYGLEYQCNENSNNAIDFDISGTQPQFDQIFTHMGFTNISARNTYTSTTSPNFEWHWRNIGTESIHYYFHTSEKGTAYYPIVIDYYNNDTLYFIRQGASVINECPDNGGIHEERLVLTPDEKQDLEIEFAQAYSDYQAVETLYNDLKDGGSTEGTSLSIASAQASDTWELRDNLLGKSPHLSKEVLMEAADRTDVLPNSVLFDILAANPDELKDESLIRYLGDKQEPLPTYMIDILKEVSAGTTYKTVLVNQMGDYKYKQVNAANRIIKSLINEEEQNYTAIKDWLSNLGGMQADIQIAGILIKEGNTTDANTLLEMIPDLYNLQGDALSLYLDDKYMLTLEMNLEQENRNIAQLNSSEIAQLEMIAENESGSARSSARTILEAFYGYDNYCDCFNHGSNKSANVSDAFTNEESPLSIEASPNPAKHYVEFAYELSDIDKDGIIIITDINGKHIQSFNVKYTKGKQAWDTRRIPSGSYVYTLKTKYFEQSGKLIIQ